MTARSDRSFPTRTPLIEYGSLSELYTAYDELFVRGGAIRSSCGCAVHCYEHHFVHVVKLFGPNRQRLYFPDVREQIIGQREGFGNFEHEERRAKRLAAFLETLQNPDAVVRPPHLNTADRAFVKEFECSQYPWIVVLVRRDGNLLTLCTAEPVRRGGGKKWFAGARLWP